MQSIISKMPFIDPPDPSSPRKPRPCTVIGSFTFHIDTDSCVKNGFDGHINQNSIIVINAFTDHTCKYAVGISCKWLRIFGEKSFALVLQGNTLQLSAFDIGCMIKCEIKSEEEDYKGMATLVFGPVSLDKTTKCNNKFFFIFHPLKYIMKETLRIYILKKIFQIKYGNNY